MADELGQAPARTPLYARHIALGGKMVDFAGYALPVQYSKGVLAEHLFTRDKAGLFDVSHMGQAVLSGRDAARKLESLVPGDIVALEPGRIRYTQFTNEQGGILDDLMVTRLAPGARGESLFLVVNAACKRADFAHLRAKLPDLKLDILEDRALLALQGPAAAAVLERYLPGVSDLAFMARGDFVWRGAELFVSRSGYTGEDGFEISLPAEAARPFADALLLEDDVEPVGLGARDSLRLEAGLCLYGHDIDATTSPIEAGLAWSISKRRRAEGGFPGATRLKNELVGGLTRQRVGLAPEGKALAREGTEIANAEGVVIGRVTSGGFAPSLGRPIAMGYVPSAFALEGTQVQLVVRGKALPARITPLPFVPNRYHRPAKG
ncbi:MAG TPA: glycine cleavage system aminomethyltransferase GcvT [Rhodoblastus sp.]|nr:glycine cleavage system aminomethyltransferase GcvT [Rhodoblastus sp.]